jgi:hypothetical protein
MAQENNYVLGRGRLYFDRFVDGSKTKTGELYFGNTPSLTVTQNNTALDHYSSESGLKIKDASVTLQNDMTGAFATDNINQDNLALWFLGTSETVTQAAATALSDTFAAVKLGRFYQLGASEATPSGARSVTNVVVKKGPAPGTAVTPTGNLDLSDLANGRIYVEPDATDIVDGDDLIVTYDLDASTRTLTIAKGTQIYGALRFISDNGVGGQRNHYYPYCKLTSNGDYALKGDDWQTASFSLEFLKLNDATDRAYIDGVASVTP